MSSSFPPTGEQAAISEKLDCSLEELIDGGRRRLVSADPLGKNSAASGWLASSSSSSSVLSRPHSYQSRDGVTGPSRGSDDTDDHRPYNRRVILKHNRSLDLAVRGIVRRRSHKRSAADGVSSSADESSRAGGTHYHSNAAVGPAHRRERTVVTSDQPSSNHQSRGAVQDRPLYHAHPRGPYDTRPYELTPPQQMMMSGAFQYEGESHPYMPVRVAVQPSIYTGNMMPGSFPTAQSQSQQQQQQYFAMPCGPMALPNQQYAVQQSMNRLSPWDAAILSTDVVRQDNGDIVVTFKQTNIITIKGDSGDLILNSGGFRTFSTRSVMNQALQPVGLRINECNSPTDDPKNNLNQSSNADWEVSDGKSYLVTFADGMVVSQSGTMSRQQMLARGSVIMQFLKQKKTNVEKQSRLLTKLHHNTDGSRPHKRHSRKSNHHHKPDNTPNDLNTPDLITEELQAHTEQTNHSPSENELHNLSMADNVESSSSSPITTTNLPVVDRLVDPSKTE